MTPRFVRIVGRCLPGSETSAFMPIGNDERGCADAVGAARACGDAAVLLRRPDHRRRNVASGGDAGSPGTVDARSAGAR